jgi:hypothetical protein
MFSYITSLSPDHPNRLIIPKICATIENGIPIKSQLFIDKPEFDVYCSGNSYETKTENYFAELNYWVSIHTLLTKHLSSDIASLATQNNKAQINEYIRLFNKISAYLEALKEYKIELDKTAPPSAESTQPLPDDLSNVTHVTDSSSDGEETPNSDEETPNPAEFCVTTLQESRGFIVFKGELAEIEDIEEIEEVDEIEEIDTVYPGVEQIYVSLQSPPDSSAIADADGDSDGDAVANATAKSLPDSSVITDSDAKSMADSNALPVADPNAKPVVDTNVLPIAASDAKPVADLNAKPIAPPHLTELPLAPQMSAELDQKENHPPMQKNVAENALCSAKTKDDAKNPFADEIRRKLKIPSGRQHSESKLPEAAKRTTSDGQTQLEHRQKRLRHTEAQAAQSFGVFAVSGLPLRRTHSDFPNAPLSAEFFRAEFTKFLNSRKRKEGPAAIAEPAAVTDDASPPVTKCQA